MTVTETASPTSATEASSETAADEAPASVEPPEQVRGLAALLGSSDHKHIGRFWIGFSLLYLLVALTTAILVGLERFDLEELEVLGSSSFFQVFTLYRMAAVFLVGLPLFVGLATYVVPLQVGARSIAFPRAAALAFWAWLIGSGTMLAAYAMNGGPGGGDTDGVELWMVSLGLVLAALVLGSVCIVTTVLAYRADGMTLARAPIFSWAMFVAGSIWILTIPVLAANLLLIYLDHRYGQQFFGVDANVWPQVSWFFNQPQIYVVAIPALGIIGEVLPVAAGRPARSHQGGFVAIALFGLMAAGAEAQPFLAPGTQDELVYIVTALAIVLPVLALSGLWADVLRGRPRPSAALLFSVFAWLMILAAVVAGAIAVIEPFHLLGTSFVTGQMNYVILASLLAAFAGIWHWGPKIWGLRLGEAPGRLAATLIFLGTIAACLPDLISGLLDQPEFVESGYDPRDGVELLNLISAIGFIVVALGVLLALVGILNGARRGRRSDPADDANPWEAETLEWATTSPPPWNNFGDDLPEITSHRPLADDATSEASD
jgi:heme/copper-type cytochrome/quinol oxidase subunit 1